MTGIRKLALLAATLAFVPAAPAVAAKRTPMIVGGTAAPPGAWPSIAFLEGHYNDHEGHENGFHCTGSLVAPSWIVTAAHCAFGNPGQPPDGMDAILGVTDYTDARRQVIAVDRFVPDPSYDSNTDLNDVALLHLRRPTSVPVMRLATSDEAAAGRYVSDVNVPDAAGWGATDEEGTRFTTVLQEAYLQIQSAAECGDRIPDFDSGTQACAGTDGRAGVCFGDSGGPLVMFDAATHQPVLWGVTASRPEFNDSDAPCSLTVPALFTWIPAFADFIHNTLATAPDPAPGSAASSSTGAGDQSVAPTAATRSARCRSARAALAAARTTERKALQRLRVARRHRTGPQARRRVSRRYRAAHSRRLRVATRVRRVCRPTT